MKKQLLFFYRMLGIVIVLFLCTAFLPTFQQQVHAAAASCGTSGPHQDQCTITITINNPNVTQYRIDQPIVDRRMTSYPGISFQASDQVTLSADGCVQTGGSGDTWKRYVNPSGDNSGARNGSYHGTVTIPNATNAQGVPLSSEISIIDAIATKITVHAASSLNLGYVDDKYSDNGYYDHDNGNNNQCANTGSQCFAGDGNSYGGSACVLVTITHQTPIQPPPSPKPAPFDLVANPTSISRVDSNGLLLNPEWGWQFNQGVA